MKHFSKIVTQCEMVRDLGIDKCIGFIKRRRVLVGVILKMPRRCAREIVSMHYDYEKYGSSCLSMQVVVRDGRRVLSIRSHNNFDDEASQHDLYIEILKSCSKATANGNGGRL